MLCLQVSNHDLIYTESASIFFSVPFSLALIVSFLSSLKAARDRKKSTFPVPYYICQRIADPVCKFPYLLRRLYKIRHHDHMHPGLMCGQDSSRRILKRHTIFRRYSKTFTCFLIYLRIRLCFLNHISTDHTVKIGIYPGPDKITHSILSAGRCR